MEYIGRLFELFSLQQTNGNDDDDDPLRQTLPQHIDNCESDRLFVQECTGYCERHFGRQPFYDTDLLLGAARLQEHTWGFPPTHPLAKAMQAHSIRHGAGDYPAQEYVTLKKRLGRGLIVYDNLVVQRCVDAVCAKFDQHAEKPLERTGSFVVDVAASGDGDKNK